MIRCFQACCRHQLLFLELFLQACLLDMLVGRLQLFEQQSLLQMNRKCRRWNQLRLQMCLHYLKIDQFLFLRPFDMLPPKHTVHFQLLFIMPMLSSYMLCLGMMPLVKIDMVGYFTLSIQLSSTLLEGLALFQYRMQDLTHRMEYFLLNFSTLICKSQLLLCYIFAIRSHHSNRSFGKTLSVFCFHQVPSTLIASHSTCPSINF